MITTIESPTTIRIRKIAYSKIREVDFNNLEFGKHISDHMLICDFHNGEWQEPQIVPFANFSLSPTALALHYGQTVFEGMKAFNMQDGRVNIFRMDKHYQRFEKSLERMCMAIVPQEIFREGLKTLVNLDRAWVPTDPDSSLYLRPFAFATEERFGVKVSSDYRFAIFTGPVGKLYAKRIKVKAETKYIRAAPGGTGATKCGGNYGGAFYATQLARQEGYDNVLWTDARDNQFIEESGMMNVMFVIDGVLVTPPLSDTTLDGVTRDSLLTIANELQIPTEERKIGIDELDSAFQNKKITEAFGVGTAAVVLPIGTIGLNGIDYELPEYNAYSIQNKLKEQVDSIRTGKVSDNYNWNFIL
jgi:branched-chain amino acid aminotransferase